MGENSNNDLLVCNWKLHCLPEGYSCAINLLHNLFLIFVLGFYSIHSILHGIREGTSYFNNLLKSKIGTHILWALNLQSFQLVYFCHIAISSKFISEFCILDLYTLQLLEYQCIHLLYFQFTSVFFPDQQRQLICIIHEIILCIIQKLC